MSGGGLVNAWLAVRQPSNTALADELDTLTLLLASRMNTLRAALLPLLTGAVAVVVPLVLLVVLAREAPLIALLLGLSWVVIALLCAQLFLARWWLRRLYRSFGGDRTAGDLKSDEWPIRHTFVASDLSLSGSLFFTLDNGRMVAYSSRRGIYEPDLTLSTLLRASTALPPALPPIRVSLGAEVQLGRSQPARVWLADGGLTGNLGIQLSEDTTSDNPFLQSSVEAHLGGIAPDSDSQLVVVDASGTSPASAKLANFALWTPGLSLFYESLRSLKVQYEAALTDDQHLARLTLVSVTRHANAYHEVIRDGVEPNARAAMLRLVNDERGVARLLGLGVSERAGMCVNARAEAAEMSTGLWPASWRQSLAVIRSGYINTLAAISTQDADAIQEAWRVHGTRLRAARAAQGQWGPTGLAVLEGKGAVTARVQ